MAWIFRCVLCVSLFQISTHAVEIAVGRSVREGERFANQKSTGSYKILNRLMKPFVNKRVPGSLVFPDDNKWSAAYQKPIIPEECERIGICKDIPNYPEELVANLLRELAMQNNTRFNKDMLEVPQIAQRIGDDDTLELCSSNEQLLPPRLAKDVNMDWHLIINDKNNPQQTFRVEICHSQDTPCNPIAYFQNGYKGRCIQKYMYRNMLAINDKKEVVEKLFQVPSCCSCVASLT